MKQTNSYFNFSEFKNGSNATTKLGNPVKFVTMCSDGRMLVQVNPRNRIVESGNLKYVTYGTPYTEKYHVNGKKYRDYDSEFDIVMDAPKRPRNSKGQFVKMG
jgi:hypothetical protein